MTFRSGPNPTAVTDSMRISEHLQVLMAVEGPKPGHQHALLLVRGQPACENVTHELAADGRLLLDLLEVVTDAELPETDDGGSVKRVSQTLKSEAGGRSAAPARRSA